LIIADTGFWVGLLDQGDRAHAQCKRALSECREPLATTWPVLTETTHLLFRARNRDAALRLLELLSPLQKQGLVFLYDIPESHWPRLFELMGRYANLPKDLADASLVLLAEHLGHGRILSTDRRDFQAYRWKNHHPFHNLLEPLD